MEIIDISDSITELAQFLAISSRSEIESFYSDLTADTGFLESLNDKISGVPAFSGKTFQHVRELHAYRSLLYLITRVVRPSVFVETGVLNGFSSAFILLAMQHNNMGKLISVDLPSRDDEILRQGTGELPAGKQTGWIIPDSLRDRHTLRLGPAQTLLPEVLQTAKPIDIFLHDSDHRYSHMMFEMCLALHHLSPSGLIIADNIEQNAAFSDLVRAEQARSLVINSYVSPTRTWQHGIMLKPPCNSETRD